MIGAKNQPIERAVAAQPKMVPRFSGGVSFASHIWKSGSRPPAQKVIPKRAVFIYNLTVVIQFMIFFATGCFISVFCFDIREPAEVNIEHMHCIFNNSNGFK